MRKILPPFWLSNKVEILEYPLNSGLNPYFSENTF
ncbi:hypothetical protein AT05_07735 [Schleiferia thermophila str. Yellowstone]|nr:hypothetical protein AT05_07735 [Schleiferia thermophila str. Yellowstone]